MMNYRGKGRLMEVVYDIESLPNFFCAGFSPLDAPDDHGYIFEISERRNDAAELYNLIIQCRRMIGFNNMYYDWPMLAYFIDLISRRWDITAADMRRENDRIFAMPENQKHTQLVKWYPAVEQVDLFMLTHLQRFSVGLKQCEFAMRSRSIQDMPFPPDVMLTPAQMDDALVYNAHDIRKTKAMAKLLAPAIAFREGLRERDVYGNVHKAEWINFNDGKIGKKTFQEELQNAGVRLYDGNRQPIQTHRPDGVRLGDVILPLINFTRPENQALLERVKAEHVFAKMPGDKLYRRDGSPVHHVMDLDGFHIDIKLGGIHGSLEREYVGATPETVIIDADVTSYYPSIAIEHRIFPQHLGPAFCDTYGRLKSRRVALDKKDPARTTLKFALNVPFGSSNDVHSIFFDPAYMLAITMNGQLMLCMLAEQFANIGARIIQVNTDGVTVMFPHSWTDKANAIYKWWQAATRMDLEFNGYMRMFIRDANNYLAEDVDGKRKRIGAYGYSQPGDEAGSKFWQQDQSELVIPKAAEAAMLDDVDPLDFLMNHPDPWDFLILKKAPRGSRLQLADGTPLPRHTRFYISRNGQQLQKIMPPIPGKENERRIGIAAQGQAHAVPIPGKKTRPAGYRCSTCGEEFKTKYAFEDHNGTHHAWKITPCNVFDGVMPQDIDFRYYLSEVEKLIIDES
jgi:hypothetical protein